MEKSIKRVEKLVHVTNSALAQMKFSLMFDDMNGHGESGSVKPVDPALGKTFIDGDDLKLCQSEFKTEANEMLAKMESMFGSSEAARKKSKAVDKIKEINRKLNLRLEQKSKLDETEQSRQKLLNLINEEKFSSGATSSWDSVQSKRTVREKKSSEVLPKRTNSILSTAKSPSKDELKSKILETQDIVNRGFQTARQLAQKVETMSKHERKERTPNTNKTASEINLRGLEGRAESSETVSTVKCRKCARRARRRREVEDVERGNAQVIEVKREEEEAQRCSQRSNLQLQRLPSLHIRGGLQLQKVHNLEIPAGGDASCVKSNTAVSFLSHEQMQNEKMGEIIEKVRKENCCCTSNNPQGNYVECFNCGKLIRVRESCVDPRKVDEILQKCNFDVFDPRIDEFVEKHGTIGSANWCKTQQPDTAPLPDNPTVDEVEVTSKKTSGKKREERPKKSFPNIQRLSDQLLKKYKQETETLENNHLKLENILQSLFKQIDESREVFETCHLFKNRKPDGGMPPKLTATKPVVVSLTGDSFRNRTKHRHVNKQKANNMNRSRDESAKRATKSKDKEKRRYQIPKEDRFSMSSSGSEVLPEAGKAAEVPSSGMSSSTSGSSNYSKYVFEKVVEETPLVQYKNRKTTDRDLREKENPLGMSAVSKNKTLNPPDVTEKRVAEEKAPSLSSSSSSKSRRFGQTDCTVPEPKTSSQSLISKDTSREDEAETKTPAAFSNKSKGKEPSESPSDESENNYESDFESVTNEPNENEDAEPEASVNKLSTISEVDSELEKKVSDEQKTMRSSRNMEMDDDSSKASETGRRDMQKRHEEGDLPEQKEENLEVLPESKKTEVASPKTAETCSKSTPTELVTSLKDILSALQEQFVRTESLAEKLTENVKSEWAGKPEAGMTLFGDVMLNTWKKPMATGLVENLRSARKDLRGEPKSPRRSETSKKPAEGDVFSMDSLSDEGGSSLGEIIVSDRRRRASEKSASSSISECSFLRLDSVRKSASNRKENSAFKLEVNSEEVLYSEGEIPSDEVLAVERFRTSSLGEVVSGKNSTASTP